ncbi:MAG: bifunctional riboflavin kinase/FAD synthetase [Actinomycetota bacterium]
MERHDGLDGLPRPDGGSVVTVGFFDGVHLGHRAVLDRTVARARELGLPSVAVTFDRHPREVLTPGREPRLLTTVEAKARRIAERGIERLLVLPFTADLAAWEPERFVGTVLRDALGARHVAVGANFTYGHRAAGTVETLVAAGPSHGFVGERVELVDLDGRRVSSSSIRRALSEGDLDWPGRALGRRYAGEGTVVGGAGRGHGLGYPTANLETSARLLLPATGIYAGRARCDRVDAVAAVSVGTNPTFGSEPLHVEAFLLDFDGDLRGRPMEVEFWARLRDERRFDSPEELVAAMDADVARTRELVAGP